MNKLKSFFYDNQVEVEKIFIIFLFFFSLFVFFNYIFIFVAPFVIGYLIALFLEPFVKIVMNKLKFSRSLSGFICIVLMIVTIGGILFLIVSQFLNQLKVLLENNPSQYVDIIKNSLSKITGLVSDFFFYIPKDNMQMINNFVLSLLDMGLNFLGEQLTIIGIAIITFIPKFFVYLFVGIISSFFFIKDRNKIKRIYDNSMPLFFKKHINNLKSGMSGAFLGYLKSQLIIMCFTAMISLFGLLILQNEYALLWCVAISIVDVLPVFGAGFVLWPLSLVSFLTGDFKTGIGTLIIYGVIQITRQIIQPKILGSQIGLDPLLTLISIYVGILVFGVLGIILGPMSIMVIKTIWESEIKI